MKLVKCLPFLFGVILLLSGTAMAASYDRALDLQQGFHFRKDKVTSVGFITKLKVGSVELKPDLKAVDPRNPGKMVRVVAILNSQSWGLGQSDAIYSNGQVSEHNRQVIQTMLYNDLSRVQVEYQAVIFEYDPRTKRYFQSFHTRGRDLKGELERAGREIALDVAKRASREVENPKNYALFIGLKPQRGVRQGITLQVAETKKVFRRWGK
uniref:DUF4390 domain-containing protein n=1 Tax=Magnetococcus massalia (strain MO-1) TaxID=451514 RepID=A0A1S7LCT2_MAGMO|nr:Conserved exported protein of unknown function [Candidatus Magnetococcus massalia]